VLAETDYSIHFHVWEPDGFRALLEHARTVEGLPFDVAAFRPNSPEFIAILRRRPGGVPAAPAAGPG